MKVETGQYRDKKREKEQTLTEKKQKEIDRKQTDREMTDSEAKTCSLAGRQAGRPADRHA